MVVWRLRKDGVRGGLREAGMDGEKLEWAALKKRKKFEEREVPKHDSDRQKEYITDEHTIKQINLCKCQHKEDRGAPKMRKFYPVERHSFSCRHATL